MSLRFVIQVELPTEGVRRMYGPVASLVEAREVAREILARDPDSVCRTFPLYDPPLVSPPSHIHPNQTTIQEQIEAHIDDVHDHVG